jgi:hypothetical protein
MCKDVTLSAMLTHVFFFPCLGDSDVHVCDNQGHVVHLFLFPCLGDYDVHVCDTQRHGHASLPVFAQDVYNPASSREEQPRSLHHFQEHPMSHREPCGFRDLHQKLQLLLQRRISQVRLLILERPTVGARSKFLTCPGP